MSVAAGQYYGLNYMPVNRQAIIQFTLPRKTAVVLKIVNHQNKEVRVLLNEMLPANTYRSVFSFGNLAAGEYAVKLIVQTENIIDIDSLTIQIP